MPEWHVEQSACSGDLDVRSDHRLPRRRLPPASVSRASGRSNQYGKGAAGEFLAIAAMADRCARRVRLGCVTHRAAEATAFDLHVDPLALLAFRLKAEGMLPIHGARPMAKSNFVVSLGRYLPELEPGFVNRHGDLAR